MAFQKGKSGNPGGRPKTLAEWRKGPEGQRLRDLAYEVLEKCASDARAKWRDRVMAAKELLERTEGKAPMTLEDADGNKMHVGVIVLPGEQASGE